MKISRISASVMAFAAISLLAACGGGGGGSVTPPGGGGGGTPPTNAPATTPPTNPPATTPPTNPPSTPPPPSTVSASSQTVSAEENFVNGDMNWYTSGTASWSNHAGNTSSAPNGSSAVDGMSCKNITEGTSYPSNAFSQHAFVGIFNNGSWEALPQAIGMVAPVAPTAGNPSHPSNTYEVENNQCEYNVHTHDYSGLVHIEDESAVQSNTFMPTYATLQSLFDVWGAQLGATGITAGASALSGPVSIYVGTPTAKDSSGNDVVNSYKLFTGAANTLQFSKHMAVWLVVGKASPTLNGVQGLPAVRFVITN